MSICRSLAALSAASLAVLLTGCAGNNFLKGTGPAVAPGIAVKSLSGRALGGQPPVVGATIQIYAAGTTYYGAASPLITTTVTTDSNGNFDTGTIICPAGNPETYLTATGGNPGTTANNPNLALMVALGPCSGIANLSFVVVNEVTTAASVYALQPFISGPTHLGAPSTNTLGLTLAFADVNQIVNIATGQPSGPALPAGSTLDVAKINTVADILAGCVNTTGGTAGDGSACGKLFSATTPPSVSPGNLPRLPRTVTHVANPNTAAPTDTITAMCNIAAFPINNSVTLYGLVPDMPPFQPTVTAQPNDYTLSVNYAPAGLSAPSSLAFDSAGNYYVTSTSSAAASVTKYTHAGVVVTGFPYSSATGSSSVAVDTSDTPFVTNSTANTVRHLTAAGVSTAVTTAGQSGLNLPVSVAIDPQGNIWVANSGANTVSAFSSSLTSLSGTGGFTGTGIVAPLGISISNQ